MQSFSRFSGRIALPLLVLIVVIGLPVFGKTGTVAHAAPPQHFLHLKKAPVHKPSSNSNPSFDVYQGESLVLSFYYPTCDASCGNETWYANNTPPNTTSTFDPPVTTGSNPTTWTLQTMNNTPLGTYTVTIGATSDAGANLGSLDIDINVLSLEPSWALPFSSGTSVSIGPKGIHGDNFKSMLDDRTGTVFTFTNQNDPDSLDIVLEPETTGTSTIPTTALASGTVLAVWKDCQLILIDHGNGWWAIYLHLVNIQVTSGDTVTTGSTLGYPTTNTPTNPACGNVQSSAEHVHMAFLNGSGTTGSYVSMLGRSLCGYPVVEQNNDPTFIILQGLTTTKDEVFQVPACSSSSLRTIASD